MIVAGNMFVGLPSRQEEERFTELLSSAHIRIERIVSNGQATAPGQWYDQDWAEWVLLLQGSASLRFEDEAEPRVLAPGDYVQTPPHARHRVEATDHAQPTVWLAVHYR